MDVTTKGLLGYAVEILSGKRAFMELAGAEQRRKDTAPYLSPRPLCVLDLANGSLRPQYTILQAEGHSVYGIDQINAATFSLTNLAYMWARAWFRYQVRAPRQSMAQNLVNGDANYMPFEDSSFDLVTSVAAFEHFLNVPGVLEEVWRVLKPGGVIWACIHLFTSPSGGHNLGYNEIPLRHLPRGVDAWDHLRARKLPFSVPLNEWRRDQYRDAFAEKFSILKTYCLTREGEELLTPEIERELAAYDRDELTCGAYVLVARKDA